MKNTISTALIISFVIAASTVSASPGKSWRDNGEPNTFFDRARVTHVEPIYRTIRVSTPREECYTQEVRTDVHDHGNKAASTVLGGVIGGAVGHRVGKHRGGATIVGAVIGAAVGNNLGREASPPHQQVSYQDVCETRTSYREEQRLEGYNVSYRYKGEDFTTRMDERPGKRIKVRVNVSPVVH